MPAPLGSMPSPEMVATKKRTARPRWSAPSSWRRSACSTPTPAFQSTTNGTQVGGGEPGSGDVEKKRKKERTAPLRNPGPHVSSMGSRSFQSKMNPSNGPNRSGLWGAVLSCKWVPLKKVMAWMVTCPGAELGLQRRMWRPHQAVSDIAY